MAELYLFDQDDNFITILTKEEGLVDTWFKDYENHVEDEFFVFNIDSNSELLQYIVDENQVAFYDRDDRLRLARMRDLSEVTTSYGGFINHEIRVICEPSFLELHDHFVEDRRITDGTAQTALNRALDGSRYVGEVTVDLGLATDNFYWIDGIEAVFKILKTWGGALKDTITLNEDNEIIERKLWIVQRLGTDNGLIVEPDYNAEEISRNTLSYPETALWGQGASLEIEDDEGELTGGHTRYITFEDVEWKVSNGDPVDKPKGQKWVGDPDALERDGYLDNSVRKHRFGHFSNQDYEDPEELLWATWQELQERKLKEVMHEATIYETDKKVSLGDTVTILDRNYNKPIELQSQITGLEYDILDDKEVTIIVGKYVDMNEDPLQKEVDDLKEDIRKPRPSKPIDNGSFPDIKPGTPVNVEAYGAFQTIQLFWDYDSKVYISHYEVYGSQISDFIPDEQHLLYRGRVSAFNHEVATDEKWYYYIRAVNTRGTVGELSNRVEASSVRVLNDDILFGEITADKLAENLDLAGQLSDGTLDWINDEPLYEIRESENRILTDVGNRIGDVLNDISDINTNVTDLLDRTADVEGSVTNITQIVDDVEGTMETTIQQLTNLDGVVSDHSSTLTHHNDLINARITRDEFNTSTGEMLNQITEVDLKADGINASVSQVRADLDGLEIGGRNLIPSFMYSSWEDLDGFIIDDAYNLTLPNTRTAIAHLFLGVEPNTDYTFTFNTEYGRANVFGVIDGSTDVAIFNYIEGSFVRTFNTGKYSEIRIGLGRYSRETNNAKYKYLKLEKGNKATDWSPAPEDIDSRLTTSETRISDLKINLDGISTTVQTTTTKLNDLTGDVEHQTTKIATLNQRADGFEQSVIDVQGDLSNAWTEMSLIEQKADNISLSVSELETDFNNLEIGGRNLLLDSLNLRISPRTGTLEVLDNYLGKNNVIKITNPVSAMSSNPAEVLSESLEVGQTYTFSVLFTYSGAKGTSQLYLSSQTGGYTQVQGDIEEGRFNRIYITVTPTSPTSTRIHLNFTGYGAIYLWGWKLEKGNKATDWSPAPEDMADRANLISYINLSTEGVRIHGEKVHISGQTIIDDGIIGTAAIANLAVDRFHLKQGIIDNVHIADATIEHGKINSVNADKITVGDLKGIDIYGAKFRSSAGTDYMEIVGGEIDLRLNNGRYMYLSPTGLYGYNSGGSVRFQADSLLVTSAALGTSNLNVYLAAGDENSLGEVRAVRRDTIPGGGSAADYSYINVRTRAMKSPPTANAYVGTDGELRVMSEGLTQGGVYRRVRASGIYANEYETNDGDILYLRTSSRVRVYGTGSSSALSDLEAGRLYNNALITNTDNAYVGVNSELRVVNKSLSGVYRDLRFNKAYANEYETNGGNILYLRSNDRVRITREGTTTSSFSDIEASTFYGTSFINNRASYIYLGSDSGVRVTSQGAASNNPIVYRNIYAADFLERSSRKSKENIRSVSSKGLDIINKLNIVNFDYIEGDKNNIGVIAEESNEISDGEFVSLSDTIFYNTLAIQEVDLKFSNKIISIEDRLDEKDLEIQYLKQKIKLLEEKVA